MLRLVRPNPLRLVSKPDRKRRTPKLLELVTTSYARFAETRMSENLQEPLFFGAVVSTDEGDARIMCMAQEMDASSRSVHYFKVDTSIDDVSFNFDAGAERNFQNELRGTGLAVKHLDDTATDIESIISDDLRRAYGSDARVITRQIPRPSLVSLFM